MSETVIPRWADEDLSKRLPAIREEGEGQFAEFKVDFPAQAHDLAKECAAFGTSGGGLVLIGVNDNCELVGVDAPDDASRDKLVERAHGIAATVAPRLSANVRLAVEDGKAVLVVVVENQSEPVFYYEGRPYIRDGRRSRPADPDEVKERVWAHPSSEHRRRQEDLEYERQQASAAAATEIRKRYLWR